MKKIKLMINLICIIILNVTFLTGCTNKVTREYVEVVVKDAHCEESNGTYLIGTTIGCDSGNEYFSEVEYNGTVYTLYGGEDYTVCKDRIGETITGVLTHYKCSDGDVVSYISEVSSRTLEELLNEK